MSTYSKSKAAALKKALKSEKNARAMAERQAKVGKAPEPAKATETKADKQRVARSKARRMAAKKKVAAKAARKMPTTPKKTAMTAKPKSKSGGSKAMVKSGGRGMVPTKVERRAKPRTTAGNIGKAISSNMSAKSNMLNKIATGTMRAGVVGAGMTGLAMAGEYVGSKIKESTDRGKKNAEARTMIRKSYEQNKANRIAKATTSTSAPATAPSTAATAPTVTKPRKTATKSRGSVTSAKPQATSTNQPKGAPVQEGPTRTPVKKKKVNRGYQNYQDVMNVEGMACGGMVHKKAGGGIISKGFEGVRAMGQAMMQPKAPQNQPKVVSDNQAVKQQAKEARMKGEYGRQLVPSNVMRAIKQTRGK